MKESVSKEDRLRLDYLYSEMGIVNCIKRELFSSSESAVAIGFYLAEVKRCEYWKATDFYKNFKSESYKTKTGITKFTEYTFYDYCRDEFSFSRRSVNRYINIFYAFATINKGGGRTKFIDERYKDYNVSQLSEMLQLNDKQREKVNPSMTVKDIRDLKSLNEGDADVNDNEDDTDGTFVNPDDVNIVFDKDFEDKTFKKKKYSVCGLIYDKFVSTPAQYSQQFVKLQEYLNKGYLLRMVLYAPKDEESDKAVNE